MESWVGGKRRKVINVAMCCLYREERVKWAEKIGGMEKLVLYRETKSFAIVVGTG